MPPGDPGRGASQLLRNCSISASSAASAGARVTPVTSIAALEVAAAGGGLAGRVVSWVGGVLLCAGLREPVGVGAGFEDVAAEGEPVDDGGAEAGSVKVEVPLNRRIRWRRSRRRCFPLVR
jgi:hypothetical protein